MADNKDVIIKCPACGKEMKKIFMPAQGINLDVCVDGCGGIYFDNREFSKFDEPHEDITPLKEVLSNKEFQKVDQHQTRVCPVCGSDMVKNYSSVNKEVEIDECYHCGGKFLDYYELDKIRSEYNTETERSADVMKKLYSDVGAEIMARPQLAKNIGQKRGKNTGIIIGLLLATIWLVIKSSSISAYFANPALTAAEFNFVIIIAIAIVAFSAGIGALIGRK